MCSYLSAFNAAFATSQQSSHRLRHKFAASPVPVIGFIRQSDSDSLRCRATIAVADNRYAIVSGLPQSS